MSPPPERVDRKRAPYGPWDEASYSLWCDKKRSDLIGFARSLGGSQEDSEEAAQDGLMSVYIPVRSPKNAWWPEDRDPVRWARKVARRRLIDIWRRGEGPLDADGVKQPVGPLPVDAEGNELDLPNKAQRSILDQAGDSELNELLNRAMREELDARERAVVNLFRLWGPKWQGIADHLGLRNRGRASETFHRAVRTLKEWFVERGIALNDLLPDDSSGMDFGPNLGDVHHPNDEEE